MTKSINWKPELLCWGHPISTPLVFLCLSGFCLHLVYLNNYNSLLLSVVKLILIYSHIPLWFICYWTPRQSYKLIFFLYYMWAKIQSIWRKFNKLCSTVQIQPYDKWITTSENTELQAVYILVSESVECHRWEFLWTGKEKTFFVSDFHHNALQ